MTANPLFPPLHTHDAADKPAGVAAHAELERRLPGAGLVEPVQSFPQRLHRGRRVPWVPAGPEDRGHLLPHEPVHEAPVADHPVRPQGVEPVQAFHEAVRSPGCPSPTAKLGTAPEAMTRTTRTRTAFAASRSTVSFHPRTRGSSPVSMTGLTVARSWVLDAASRGAV
jgi:hypothetical protein